MEFNPILIRESRARWRGWRGFALVLGYAALLSAMMAIFYGEAAGNSWGAPDSGRSSSQLGARLFNHLCWMQALGWMLIAPALTASSIAGERENGLLESLHLAPISPTRIVLGNLWSAMLLILLMLAIALPPVALCFVLGGVSPGEFYAATTLHAATAFFCASLGLFVSAWSRRAGNAMRTAFAVIIVWGISSAIAMAVSFTPATAFNWSGWLYLYRFYGLTNPIIAAQSITNDDLASIGATPGLGGIFLIIPVWSASALLQGLLGIILLALAARALRRPLPEAHWSGESTQTTAKPTDAETQSTPAPLPTPKPQHNHWSLPLIAWIKTSNPVLQRELRGKFKVREPSPWTAGCMAPVVMGLLYGYARLMWEAWSFDNDREGIWWILSFVGLFVIVLMCGVMGAAAFTREREAGTWEALGLSLLSSWQIIWGKVLPPIFTTVAYSVLAWPLMLPALIPLPGVTDALITPTQAIATALILLASAWNLTAFGMLVSWHCRRTAAATGWLIGILFFAYLLGPIMLGIAIYNDPGIEVFIQAWHPFLALGTVVDMPRRTDETGQTFLTYLSILSLFAIGCLWIVLLLLAMRDGVREHDAKRRENSP